MKVWSPELQLAACMLMNILGVFSHVTVRSTDLRPCEKDDQVCVTNLKDCGPRPPSSVQKTLNMSCYFMVSDESVTCEWSEDSSSRAERDVSLIFRSEHEIYSCGVIFYLLANLNITARIKDYMTGSEIWSQPHPVFLDDATKPSQPELTVLHSTADSVHVSWRGRDEGSCRLRYRANHTRTWSQTSEFVVEHQDQTLTYIIKDLLPFTAYRAAVACREDSDIWSDWSSDVTAWTLDRVPSRPLEVCYRVEKTDSLHLHLMWKDVRDAGDRLLGYQVSCKPAKKKQQLFEDNGVVQNVTEATARLEVEEGNYSVTVTAFNTAGYGPATHLSIDTQRESTLPSVRNLAVSSSFSTTKDLLVQWEQPAAPPSVPPVSHFAVQWHSETHPSTSRWLMVDSFNTSIVIQDVDPHESYLISVFPVYNQQCGSPQSLTVGLQWGGEDISRHPNVMPLRTGFGVEANRDISISDDALAVAVVTPLLLLLAVAVLILSRSVYTSYFLPPVSSPRGSTAGRWLMDPNQQKTAERNILDIEDFQVTDILGEKSLIIIAPNSQHSSGEDLHEDTSLLSISRLITTLSTLKLDAEYISDAPVIPEHPLVSLQSYDPDYSENGRHAGRVFLPEESQAADLLHQTQETNGYFPQKEEDGRQLDLSETLHQKDTAVKYWFCEAMANAKGHSVHQMTCEVGYEVNSPIVGETDGEGVSGQTDCSYLVCETDYLANTCFSADKDRTSSVSTAC